MELVRSQSDKKHELYKLIELSTVMEESRDNLGTNKINTQENTGHVCIIIFSGGNLHCGRAVSLIVLLFQILVQLI